MAMHERHDDDEPRNGLSWYTIYNVYDTFVINHKIVFILNVKKYKSELTKNNVHISPSCIYTIL
jgi:hypothetical protein